MQETPRGFFVDIPSETKTDSDVLVETKVNPTPQAPSLPLTRKQKALRAKNKLAKASRKKNRG